MLRHKTNEQIYKCIVDKNNVIIMMIIIIIIIVMK